MLHNVSNERKAPSGDVVIVKVGRLSLMTHFVLAHIKQAKPMNTPFKTGETGEHQSEGEIIPTHCLHLQLVITPPSCDLTMHTERAL